MTDSNNRVKILVIAPYIGLVKLLRKRRRNLITSN